MLALTELTAALQDHGVEKDAVRTASALLGVSRIHGWGGDNLPALVAWLEQIAVEVLRANPPAGAFRSNRTVVALDDLEDRLKANNVTADVRKVASSILYIASGHAWGSDPAQMVAWLHQLAVDVAM
jgi:hypothetical protein